MSKKLQQFTQFGFNKFVKIFLKKVEKVLDIEKEL